MESYMKLARSLAYLILCLVFAHPALGQVSISITQPTYGFNVIPRSTRRVFATVKNGTTNGVNWSLTSGSATLSSTTGSWIDVTAPATGSSCSITGPNSAYTVSSATQFTLQAQSRDDNSKIAII